MGEKAEDSLVFHRDCLMTGDDYARESILWYVQHLLTFRNRQRLCHSKKRRELYKRIRAGQRKKRSRMWKRRGCCPISNSEA